MSVTYYQLLYRERAEVLADILGPAAREVLQRFSRVWNMGLLLMG